MNHNFGRLAGATLMTGLGLWTVAMPADATPILGFFTHITEIGVNQRAP